LNKDEKIQKLINIALERWLDDKEDDIQLYRHYLLSMTEERLNDMLDSRTKEEL